MRTLEKNKFKSPYVSTDGKYLPGVTTILGLLNKPALMNWAWSQGLKNIPLRQASDQAIDIGNIAHYLIECWVQEKEAVLDPLYSKEHILLAYQMLEFFKDYWYERGSILQHSEHQLIDDELGYGGTLDLVVECEDSPSIQVMELWDVKTSKDIWPEHWLQLAAYRELYRKRYGITLQPKILLITKELKFKAAEISEEKLQTAWLGFKHLAEAYPYIKQIQSRE